MAEDLTVPALDRFRHIYIPGQTQYGKSTLMANQIYDDIIAGRGVCVIDAKGDLIRQVLDAFPAHRVKDAIYFDREHPLPIDILTHGNTFERDALVHELTQALLRKVDEDDAPEMGQNIRNILRTIFEYNKNQSDPKTRATLLDVFYFMDDEERQKQLLGNIKDPKLKRRWNKPKSIPAGQAMARITLRTDDYYFSDFLGAIFDVPKPPVNMEWVINNRKILLINLSPMSPPMLLYATMILSQIRQVVDRRGEIPPSEQIPFFLYCDEFQEYQTTDFPKFMARAGGLGLSLTLANQWISQLDSEVREAVLTASTFFLFRMTKQKDITHFENAFPFQAIEKPIAAERKRLEARLAALDEKYYLIQKTWNTINFDQHFADRTKIENDYLFEKLRDLPPNEVDPPNYLSILPDLGVGEALFKSASGERCKLKTPEPLGERSNYAEYIKKRTLLPFPQGYACETVDRSYHESTTPPVDTSNGHKPDPGPQLPPSRS